MEHKAGAGRWAFILLWPLAVVAITGADAEEVKTAPTLFIQTTWVFRGGGHDLEEGIAIICRNGRIEAIGPDLEAPPGAIVLEASGTCALPGLIDAHVRLHDGFLISPVYLFSAWGVTTVRDFENIRLRAQHLKETIDSGAVLGPNIVFSGESLAGPDQTGPIQLVAENPDSAPDLVNLLVRDGAEAVHLSSGITKEIARAVVEQAEATGLPVAADLLVSRSLNALEAVRLGAHSLERLGGVPQAVRKDDAPELPVDQSPLFYWLWRDTKKESDLIREIVQGGVYLVPTLVAFEKMSTPGALNLSEQNRPSGLPASMVEYWQEVQSGMDQASGWAAGCRLHLDHAKAFIGKAEKAGAKIVTGSATPTPGVGPGTGLLREIELLIEAGLTPAQALNAATIEAARCLKKDQDLGSLEPGKKADLLIVQGNPFEAITALKEIRWVIQGGRLVKREEIPGLKTIKDN